VEVPRINDEDLENYLEKNSSITDEEVGEIVHEAQGDLNDSLKILNSGYKSGEFEKLFVQWVRDAFMVKKKPQFLKSIIFWAAEIAGWNRGKQKKFLNYCSKIFKLAFLQNYQSENLVYKKIDAEVYNWAGFSKFSSGANIDSI